MARRFTFMAKLQAAGKVIALFAAMAAVLAVAAIFLVIAPYEPPFSVGSGSPGETPSSVDIGSPGETPSTVGVSVGSPATSAQRFLSAWETLDWATISGLVSVPESRVDAVLQEWERELHVAGVRFTIRSPQVGGETAEVPFRAAVEIDEVGTWEYDSELSLVRSVDGWLVVWDEKVMHPTLAAGDRLDLVTTWPERGIITDNSGRQLTRSIPWVTIGLVPERIVSREDVVIAFEEVLGLSGEVIDGILERPGVQPDWFLSVATIDREDYVDVWPALFPVPGVTFRLVERRAAVEPGGAGSLLGTTGEVTAETLDALGSPYGAGSIVGRFGLEAAFEHELAGTPTSRIVRRGIDGSVETIATFPGTPAAELRTSLSFDAQRAAESALSTIDLPASLVAIDIATGEIRASANTPAEGFSRATSGLYPPGSTFKIIVAAALLENGLEPESPVSCPHVITISGKEFTNAVRLPSSMTFEDAFARSCNTAFIELAADLGPTAIADVARRFGFGTRLDIGIPAADPSFQVSADAVENAAAAIGQGTVLVSPLSLASVAATASSGVWHPPTLIAGVEIEAVNALDPDVVTALQMMMRSVVDHGTGQAAAIDGIEVAGKTGTAEVVTTEGPGSVAWFAGYAGDLSFAINVEGGASGGSTAGPIAAAFLEALATPDPSPLPECVAAGSDWVMFQGDITRSGCSLAEPILTPIRLWRAEVGISGWLNSPIVADGVVVVGSAGDMRGAADDADGVYALDLETGERRWHFGAANDVNGVAASGDVVVATGDEGTVWGLDLLTGAQIWSFDTGAPAFTNPLIVDGLVIVGDGSGVLWALKLDGTEVWHTQLDGAIRGGAASDGRMVYAISDSGDAAAFTLDGFKMWRTRIAHVRVAASGEEVRNPVRVFAAPTVAGDELVIGYTVEGGTSGPAVVGLDRYVGSIVWRGSDPDQLNDFANLRNSPARNGDALIIASSLSRGVQGIDPTTGKAIWATRTATTCEKQWASPIIVGDLVVLPRPDGSVQGFDATSGESRWRFVPAGESETAPTANCVAGGTQVHDGFQLHASVAIAPDGTLIVASTSNAIYAIGEGT